MSERFIVLKIVRQRKNNICSLLVDRFSTFSSDVSSDEKVSFLSTERLLKTNGRTKDHLPKNGDLILCHNNFLDGPIYFLTHLKYQIIKPSITF